MIMNFHRLKLWEMKPNDEGIQVALILSVKLRCGLG